MNCLLIETLISNLLGFILHRTKFEFEISLMISSQFDLHVHFLGYRDIISFSKNIDNMVTVCCIVMLFTCPGAYILVTNLFAYFPPVSCSLGVGSAKSSPQTPHRPPFSINSSQVEIK